MRPLLHAVAAVVCGLALPGATPVGADCLPLGVIWPPAVLRPVVWTLTDAGTEVHLTEGTACAGDQDEVSGPGPAGGFTVADLLRHVRAI